MHRDLKRSNILIDENWHGLICDFGLSTSGWGEGLPTPDAGTWSYAAPEQLRSDAPYDEKVDVYSFGLVLYALIADRPAFDQNVPAFPGGQPRQLPPVPERGGAMMQELIPRCCQTNPSDRPSFRAILEEFRACGFVIFPKVESEVVARYVQHVEELEKTLRCWTSIAR
jgi:serine/threonine protein kinase